MISSWAIPGVLAEPLMAIIIIIHATIIKDGRNNDGMVKMLGPLHCCTLTVNDHGIANAGAARGIRRHTSVIAPVFRLH